MKQLKQIGMVATMVCAFIYTTGTLADLEGEKQSLSDIVRELKALEPLIDAAEQQADSKSRIQFQYVWLRKDLKKIIQGVQEHIDSPRIEPRTFEPLEGDYRR